MLATEVAILQRQIWQSHDLRNFTQLCAVASQFYVSTGCQEKEALVAARLLAEAYSVADEAEASGKAGGHGAELALYRKCAENICEIRRILSRCALTGRIEVAWWVAFRRRRTVRARVCLFSSLLLGTGRPMVALKGSYYLQQAAIMHSKRNWPAVDGWLTRYWVLLKGIGARPMAGGV